MAMDLSKQKKDTVPKIPLRRRIRMSFPLGDIFIEERMGQRMIPPSRKRMKAISVVGRERERILRITSLME
jgi:hypothetical protein